MIGKVRRYGIENHSACWRVLKLVSQKFHDMIDRNDRQQKETQKQGQGLGTAWPCVMPCQLYPLRPHGTPFRVRTTVRSM
jgi:hypothetical protein